MPPSPMPAVVPQGPVSQGAIDEARRPRPHDCRRVASLPKGIRQLPSAWLDPVGDDVLPNISA